MTRCSIVLAAAAILMACGEKEQVELSARQTESAAELVGGPAALARVGDFLLKNDQVRMVIGDHEHSWSFGVFGGSLLDADRVRPEARYQYGEGLDAFGEMFATVNLLAPNPGPDAVAVLADGSDGKEAAVRVSGQGTMMFDTLKLLANDLIRVLFKELKARFYFDTVYRLEPGVEAVEVTTSAVREYTADDFCGEFKCTKKCDGDGRFSRAAYKVERKLDVQGVEHVCPKCECDAGQEMSRMTGPVPLLQYIAGDIHPLTETIGELLGEALKIQTVGTYSGGVVGGDFLFFGSKTDVFLPGLGFDEQRRIFDDLYEGRDSLTFPLSFDFAAAKGEDVSYIYFSKDPDAPAGAKSQVLVPLVTSSATVVITAGNRCLQASTDDAECDDVRRWTFARYLGIGKGDIGSAVDIYYKVRNGVDPDTGEPLGTGRIEGAVFWEETLAPVSHADVVLLKRPHQRERLIDGATGKVLACTAAGDCGDPEARCEDGECVLGCEWQTYAELIRCNQLVSQVVSEQDETVTTPGMPGVLNQWETDVGTDPLLDGRYGGFVAPGQYVVVARTKDSAMSKLVPVTVAAGEHLTVNLGLPTSGRVHYRITDETGHTVPARLVFVSLDEFGQPLKRDGMRHPELGDSRMNHGIRMSVLAVHGEGEVKLEPGRYRVMASHGLEYSRDVLGPVEVVAGETTTIEARVVHEVDTTGWIGGDFHLHAIPSVDSGMKVADRVSSCVAEGLEYVVATDHDILLDYRPYVKELGLEQYVKTAVGVELSTLEMGHFNAYPLDFDALDLPSHGGVDWLCMDGQQVFDALRALGVEPEATVVQANHPTDGVMGYLSQMGVDQYTLDRSMQVFGLDIGSLQPKLSELMPLVEAFAQTDPALKAFLETSPIDLKTLPNPAMRKVSCDFDALELMNAKRQEFLRIPTVREVAEFNRCILGVRGVAPPADPFDMAAKETVVAVCADLQAPPECEGEVKELDHKQRCAFAADLFDELAWCMREEVTVHDCKEAARFAFAKYSIRTILQRTQHENNERFMLLDHDPSLDDPEDTPDYCSLDVALGVVAVPAERLDDSCVRRYGVLDLWFRLLNHGLFLPGMADSDSHDLFFEAGFPRTYVRSSTDVAWQVESQEVAQSVRAGRTLVSAGPFVTAAIGGAGPGETVKASGKDVELDLEIQTPSWFGVDRVEIYRNGLLEMVLYAKDIDPAGPALEGDPAAVVDFSGTLALPEPKEDSWYVVVAMGLSDEGMLSPTYTMPAFGNLLLPEIVSMAFAGLMPAGISFPLAPLVPDYFPMFAYAVTNPIFVDVDGDGYRAPLPAPLFCEHACTPLLDAEGAPAKSDCPAESRDLVCLADEGSGTGGLCGLDIHGGCIYELTETAQLPLVQGGCGLGSDAAVTRPSGTLGDDLRYMHLLYSKFRQ